LSKPDELVTVYQGANVTEAHFVKNLLADEGIEAHVTGEYEPLSLIITPSDVMVHSADQARAREIIDAYDEEQIRRAERPDWICPACGAKVIGALDDCDRCDAPRPGTEELGEEETDE